MNPNEAQLPNWQGRTMGMDVLDHGFVGLRNLAGPTRRDWNDFDADDVDPANAARMSFDQFDKFYDKDRTHEQDLKLCEYLMKNWHTSPFEMIEVWLEMKLPIFVARQFVRHRTVSINEVSGRYVTLPAEWYIPEVVGGKPPKAKQGQVDTLDKSIQEDFQHDLNERCRHSYDRYTYYIERGVAAEHARMLLHLNHYTHWLWKQDLHNMMRFLSLRDHSHAQVEAQAYAQAIDKLLRAHLPNCMSLYDQYRKRP
jgi:thymidylate synthase (FAD)